MYATQSTSAGFSPASSRASWRTVRITPRWCLAVSPGRNPEKIIRICNTKIVLRKYGGTFYIKMTLFIRVKDWQDILWGLMSSPWPGGVMYVRLGFDRTSPSLMIPTPILLALPSNPITTVMVSAGRMKQRSFDENTTSPFISQNQFLVTL